MIADDVTGTTIPVAAIPIHGSSQRQEGPIIEQVTLKQENPARHTQRGERRSTADEEQSATFEGRRSAPRHLHEVGSINRKRGCHTTRSCCSLRRRSSAGTSARQVLVRPAPVSAQSGATAFTLLFVSSLFLSVSHSPPPTAPPPSLTAAATCACFPCLLILFYHSLDSSLPCAIGLLSRFHFFSTHRQTRVRTRACFSPLPFEKASRVVVGCASLLLFNVSASSCVRDAGSASSRRAARAP